MNAKSSAVALFSLLPMLAGPAVSQGFAGLGTDAEGFSRPSLGTDLSFPKDHGAHPDFRIEWWYLTANLSASDGRDYGIQWTLFRSAVAPETGTPTEGWQSPQIWMGHAGLTTPDAHFSAERLARGGIGQAGVLAAPFEAWIDDWRMAATGDGADEFDALSLTASGPDFSYDLTLTATGPLVPHGDAGYSVKSPQGQASYYYSQPFYEIAGHLSLPDGDVEVTGHGWLDREWSSQPLSETQDGWDWISLHFDGGAKLMGFRLRDREGAPFTSATWIDPDGTPTPYGNGALTLTPLEETETSAATVPTVWQVEMPGRDLDVRLEAINPQAWMATSFPYWEGPVRVTGSHPGRGYLEMTGYGD
ncbi:lipocalin-like domain-containing protein [Tropicimonas isoalkanivorans]|uniref:Predicted secreted hydrolase n=1 Tax=Tropicimonas isoalkanivorans TaxID=441112 RepID=A0A1I1GPA3_9RHOB|nr:lipocalin-like domain-containing protein [Tropicimonas isoalkanivorans]SFC11728.1 Predicted secreted hydrolase [Tropicimonas isoalkanivorans]